MQKFRALKFGEYVECLAHVSCEYVTSSIAMAELHAFSWLM